MPTKASRKKKFDRSTAKASRLPVQKDLPDADLTAVIEFCQGLSFEEMPLAAWEQAFQALDLEIPLWITADDAANGCERQVSFSKTHRCESQEKDRRELSNERVVVPAGSKSGHRLVHAGKGDQFLQQRGDLVIVVMIK